jgi:hypothetical protein
LSSQLLVTLWHVFGVLQDFLELHDNLKPVKKIAFLFIIVARKENEWMKTLFLNSFHESPPPSTEGYIAERGSIAFPSTWSFDDSHNTTH